MLPRLKVKGFTKVKAQGQGQISGALFELSLQSLLQTIDLLLLCKIQTNSF